MVKKKGLLIVISGPSGAGKGTICKKLVEKHENINLSVSATTRKPREGEIEGVSYYYKSKSEFENMIDNDEFLEFAKIYENYYGTPKKTIFDEINKGNDVILEIEMQGAMQIKKSYPEAVFVFILPPSLSELKSRIVGRGTETNAQIEMRFNSAYNEIKLVGEYDYFVFNNVVEKSVEDIENIIMSEKMKVIRYKDEIIDLFEKEILKC
ncbi:guanylate kinase [Peptostreptococcus porci]|uniref:guanylate kinase n=1 Tax=Peptostreptococcus porci TaxID=2652282 RepID=UPI002A8DC91B|nr:guanylate kinase [Peptostreptococcus porci]MDY4561696.1 guanylate kinase [Peptostreptococcus porci]MDY5435916.1 guanylate kinase [Peptostreptococcus porci]MDY5479079.1 guanylate kinase [Peptostreptococcus porci]